MDAYFSNHQGKKCLLLGGNDYIGRQVSAYCDSTGMDLYVVDLQKFRDILWRDKYQENYECVKSGDPVSFEKMVDEALACWGDPDYIICNYYLEQLRKQENIQETDALWEEVFQDWEFSTFLFLKLLVSKLEEGKKRKIVFFNSARGYTGEGEGEGALTGKGSLIEAACSSGVTGMMTSIARSIIPKGYAVNGIALGENYEDKWNHIEWALNLWLSGMGEYSCGEIYRVY